MSIYKFWCFPEQEIWLYLCFGVFGEFFNLLFSNFWHSTNPKHRCKWLSFSILITSHLIRRSCQVGYVTIPSCINNHISKNCLTPCLIFYYNTLDCFSIHNCPCNHGMV